MTDDRSPGWRAWLAWRPRAPWSASRASLRRFPFSRPHGRDAEAFAEHCRRATHRNMRDGAVALAAVVVLAWPLDLLLDAPTARGLVGFRVITVVAAAGYLAGLRWLPALARRPYLASSGALLAAIVGCLANAPRAGLDMPWIDHTYLLPFATLLGLDPLARRAWLNLALAGGFVAAYLAWFPAQIASPNLAPFITTMTIATLGSVTLGHILYGLSWRQFTLRRDLDRTNADLEAQAAWQTRELQALHERAARLHAAERSRVSDELGERADLLVARMQSELRDLGAALAGPSQGSTAIDRLRGLTDELRFGMRRIVADLGPDGLDHGDLAPALARLLDSMRSPDGPALSAEIDPTLVGLPPARATAAYRVAQEALTNALRHAHASSITLRARARGGGLVLELEDDGRGLERPSDAAGTGQGVPSMRERARSIGATLRLRPRPGGGTRLTLELAASAARSLLGSRSE